MYKGDQEKIEEVGELIAQNYADKLTIEELAKQAGMCETKLKFCFRKYFQMSLHQYQIKYRMEQAAKLLHLTDQSIQDIALQVGYSSISHFTHTFKIYYRLTPTEFRKKQEEF